MMRVGNFHHLRPETCISTFGFAGWTCDVNQRVETLPWCESMAGNNGYTLKEAPADLLPSDGIASKFIL
jgi:hypothetical protein